MTNDSTNPNATGANEVRLDDLLRRAEALSNAGDLEGAVALLSEAADVFPDSPLPHHDLSVVYLNRLRRDTDHQEVWENLSDDEGFFEEAVCEAEAAIEIDADFAPAHNNLGTLFALRGWWADAIEEWEISLSIDAGQSQVREEMVEARKHIE